MNKGSCPFNHERKICSKVSCKKSCGLRHPNECKLFSTSGCNFPTCSYLHPTPQPARKLVSPVQHTVLLTDDRSDEITQIRDLQQKLEVALTALDHQEEEIKTLKVHQTKLEAELEDLSNNLIAKEEKENTRFVPLEHNQEDTLNKMHDMQTKVEQIINDPVIVELQSTIKSLPKSLKSITERFEVEKSYLNMELESVRHDLNYSAPISELKSEVALITNNYQSLDQRFKEMKTSTITDKQNTDYVYNMVDKKVSNLQEAVISIREALSVSQSELLYLSTLSTTEII